MWLPRTQGAALCEAGPQPSVLFFVARALEKEECRTVAMQDAALSLARLHWRLPGDVDTALAGHMYCVLSMFRSSLTQTPTLMMPGSVSPSPLPGPHAAADANASLRMHEVW